MSHRRRRLSRVLLALLGLIITVGLFTYVRKLSSSSTARAKAVKVAAATQPQVAVEPAITRAPDPVDKPLTTAPTTAGVTEAPKPHVTEAPVPPAAGSVASAPAAPKADLLLAAAPISSQKVTVQPTAPPLPPGAGGATLANARAKMQAGNLLEARDLANGGIASAPATSPDAAAARQILSEINQIIVFSPRRFPDDKWGGTYSVQPGDRLDRIGSRYGLTPGMLMKLNGISDPRRLRAGATIKVLKGPFHAVVRKNAFRLDLYLGAPSGPDSLFITSFPVALGTDDSTPEGKWLVEPQKKIKNPVYYSPRGEGIIDADDPKNPLGEYWIGLAGTEGDAVGKQSYGIHGTIEPDSIGKQASMGCIRLRNEDVAVVFDAVVEGKSTVLVVD